MPAAPREIIASRGSSVYPDEPQPPYFPTAAIVDSGASTPRLLDEKRRVIDTALEREDQGDKFFDPERDGLEVPKRPFLITHAVIVGLAMILVVVVEMACVAKVGKRRAFPCFLHGS